MRAQPGFELEPVGRLDWDRGSWRGELVLPGWQGFQARLGPYASLSSGEPSDGTAMLGVSAGSGDPPAESQARAIRFLVENADEVSLAVQQAIFAEYPRLQEMYGYEPAVAEEIMPGIGSPAGLRDLIGLSTVHVLDVEKDGLACVGFELGCSWDEEHGLGVMTHGARVLEVGAADASFNAWTARGDGGTGGFEPPAPSRPPAPPPQKAKWWEFWKKTG
jgi:uncharacterized protein DUF6985